MVLHRSRQSAEGYEPKTRGMDGLTRRTGAREVRGEEEVKCKVWGRSRSLSRHETTAGKEVKGKSIGENFPKEKWSAQRGRTYDPTRKNREREREKNWSPQNLTKKKKEEEERRKKEEEEEAHHSTQSKQQKASPNCHYLYSFLHSLSLSLSHTHTERAERSCRTQ